MTRGMQSTADASAVGGRHPAPERAELLADYRLAVRSREASVLGRQEVLAGRAPFGIFGDGKEIAQLALARVCRPGDWRAGYYRDQTWAFATGMCTLEEFFAQLYTDTAISADPASGGRQMSSHFSTRVLDATGAWKSALAQVNSSADLTAVGSQMPRLLGLAYASKLYRERPALAAAAAGHTVHGDEVAFGSIGNASTSEGLFWETMNAAGVLQVPLVVSVWDDGFGISVPNELQTVKASISRALAGFEPADGSPGVAIHRVSATDYRALREVYSRAAAEARTRHVPALVHVVGMTQPLGHSSSGSHERYKSAERLRFEIESDPIVAFRTSLVAGNVASAATLDAIAAEERGLVRETAAVAWEKLQAPIRRERDLLLRHLEEVRAAGGDPGLSDLIDALAQPGEVTRRLVAGTARRALLARRDGGPGVEALRDFARRYQVGQRERYSSHLYSSSVDSPRQIATVPPQLAVDPPLVDARLVLQQCFDQNLARDPRIFIVGEDVGRLGDVNLVFEGLQERHGADRLIDAGIREATILGQGIGAALRGLRPVVDIQYLDYFLYALQVASDDLATLRYRSAGGQMAPVIIRTKGHRLQGIWHAGSPMIAVMQLMRGVHLAVPRNGVQAAGFYNTFFRGDDPAMVIEVLNGYRLKEQVPSNIGEFCLPIGVPETLRPGRDVTVVTYGACCRIVLEAAELLAGLGIELEVIDVQTLNPFDVQGSIASSLRRTHALLVVDEDVPGGASAFIFQQVLEVQSGFEYLEATPRTLTASENRTPVGNDGDYFCKPNREDVAFAAYALMRERDPDRFGSLAG